MKFDSVSEYNLRYEKLTSLKFCKSIADFSLTIYYFDKLTNSQDIDSNKVRITNKKRDKTEFVIKGPEGEEIDSFILTFRFFIQNNEPSSIANLSKTYSENYIDNILKDEFENIRNNLKIYLDQPVMNCRVKNSKTNERIVITRRSLMEAVIYGFYSHTNTKHRNIYENYVKNNNLLLFLQTMKKFLEFLSEIYNLNQRLLNRAN